MFDKIESVLKFYLSCTKMCNKHNIFKHEKQMCVLSFIGFPYDVKSKSNIKKRMCNIKLCADPENRYVII